MHYKANKNIPVFNDLKNIMIKTAGIVDVIARQFKKHDKKIDLCFVYGSTAAGNLTAESDVHIMIVGDFSFAEFSKAISGPQKIINREINPTIYTSKEFKHKVKQKDHFITTVLNDEKIYIIGSEDELGSLVK